MWPNIFIIQPYKLKKKNNDLSTTLPKILRAPPIYHKLLPLFLNSSHHLHGSCGCPPPAAERYPSRNCHSFGHLCRTKVPPCRRPSPILGAESSHRQRRAWRGSLGQWSLYPLTCLVRKKCHTFNFFSLTRALHCGNVDQCFLYRIKHNAKLGGVEKLC